MAETKEQKEQVEVAIPTKEQKDKAKKILGKSKGKVYVNESGEFFTREDLAALSVKNNKEKYAVAYESK